MQCVYLLADKLDDFAKYFIAEDNKVKNMNLFKRRILGLTSYFPDIDALLPEYNKGRDFIVKKIPMSDFQFGVYEEARIQERKLEQSNSKKRNKLKEKKIFMKMLFLLIVFFQEHFVILFFQNLI